MLGVLLFLRRILAIIALFRRDAVLHIFIGGFAPWVPIYTFGVLMPIAVFLYLKKKKFR